MNQQILSQDEVDALLQGITGDSPTAEPVAAPSSGPRQHDPFNQDRLVNSHMPALEGVNERFARHVRSGLHGLIGKSPEVSVGSIKVHKYSAFLGELVVPTNFNVMSIKPLRGLGLVVCDPSLVFAVIDALYGGVGKYPTRIEGREFSATEGRVITRLVEMISLQYKRAWAALYPLELCYQRSEMQPQFAAIAGASDLVVSTAFTLELGESSGAVHLCLPYATLEPIRDVLYAANTAAVTLPDRRWEDLLKTQIQAAEVDLVAELAHAPATVEQLLSFKPGDFIELDLDPMIQAKIDGVPVFDAHYGISNNRYSIKIDQLISSSNLTWIGESAHGS